MSRRYTKTVFVPKKEIERLDRLLDEIYDREDMEREGIEPGSTLFLRTVEFDDGYKAAVRVYAGHSGIWSEAFLFDQEGLQVCCSDDCSYEHIDGEWSMEDKDA